jgi:uncharacterized protein YxeA
MKKILILLYLLLSVISAFFLGKAMGDPNKYVIYGDTGLPRNCRAIITANINGYKFKEYTAEEALNSIDRNCGFQGYSWGLK